METLTRSAHAAMISLRESSSALHFCVLTSTALVGAWIESSPFSIPPPSQILLSLCKPVHLNCVTRCKLLGSSLSCLFLSPPLLHQYSQPLLILVAPSAIRNVTLYVFVCDFPTKS